MCARALSGVCVCDTASAILQVHCVLHMQNFIASAYMLRVQCVLCVRVHIKTTIIIALAYISRVVFCLIDGVRYILNLFSLLSSPLRWAFLCWSLFYGHTLLLLLFPLLCRVLVVFTTN